MPMEAISERTVEEAPRLRLVPPDGPSPELALMQQMAEERQQVFSRAEAMVSAAQLREPLDAQVLQVLALISQALAIRALLGVAIVMTFVMAWRTMSHPGWPELATLVLFGLLSIGPLAWLASRGKG